MGIDKKVMRRFSYKHIIGWIAVVAIFGFLGKMVWGNWNQVKGASFTFDVFLLFMSTLIFAFSYFVQIWAWYLITLKLGIALSTSDTLKSWFYSQLGKYLPGKVWLLLGRFHFYESQGKSKKSISIALYLETVTMMMAAGLICFAALISFDETRSFYPIHQLRWWVLPVILAFFSIHPRVLEKMSNWVLFKFKKESISLPFSYYDVLRILLICILTWLVGGIGFYLFVKSLFPVSPSYVLFLTGALAFSSMLGLVALFAPSGLGVREGALVYLLSFLMATPVAVIVSVLTRIWMTLIEIGLIGVVYLLQKFQRPDRRKKYGEA
jgi:uncharacterized membrane protein YbhN (UPF0104 family)